MTTRLANTITLIGVALFGCIYLFYTYRIASQPSTDAIGPAYMPAALGVLLLVFCAIAAVREYRSESTEFVIENKAEILLTAVLTAAYFAAWQFIGYFYVMTGIFFVALVAAYTRKNLSLRGLGFAVLYAVIFAVSLYAIFGWLLETNFV